MQPLDDDIQNAQALVVDGNPTSRSMLAAMLRDFGVGRVLQAARPNDARRHLENRKFDIVLCEQHFVHRGMTGRDLLDELRRNQLLPLDTVFVMVTGEASYAEVAEAAESALDSYLLKPHTAAALGERITQSRRRKRVLKDIFDAITAGDHASAARLCLTRFRARGEFWLYAARIGAELFLRLGEHDTARELYDAVLQTQALPWARLGVARAYDEGGQTKHARRTLESLIADNPSNADAYDVMGRLQVEQGELDGALETYRTAAEITPASLSRLQKRGMLAFLRGENAEAEQALDRACLIGISSKMFDLQTLYLLALLRFGRGDSKGLQRTFDNLSHALERFPDSVRIQRLHANVRVLRELMHREVPKAVASVRALADEIRSADFDFEAAGNFIALLGRLRRTEIQLPQAEDWLTVLSGRFCTSKAATEMLACAAWGVDDYMAIVRGSQARVAAIAEAALTHTLRGRPDEAVRELLAQGEQLLNAKLADLAAMTLKRHAERIEEAASLTEAVSALQRRAGRGSARGTLVPQTGRAAGSLAMRV